MIDPINFISALRRVGITMIAGVPDSLLKEVCACITDTYGDDRHVIACNEGSAVGMAIGHYLATGSPALVYMQNSGLGNAVNPLTSLSDPEIYAVPIVMLVGWRGEILPDGSQLKDEPQHVKQGRVTLELLRTLGIPFLMLDGDSDPHVAVRDIVEIAVQRSGPVALVVRKGTFGRYRIKKVGKESGAISREEAIGTVVELLPDHAVVVSTTGMPSRELFELRRSSGAGHQHDFLTVGGMGHASSIATGIAIAAPQRRIVCMDGDGAVLMHAGSLTNAAQRANLVHVVLNNGAHDSVGGQPTRAAELDLSQIAQACGYSRTATVSDLASVRTSLGEMLQLRESCFLEIRCRRGNRPDLGRPDRTPLENRRELMAFLKGMKT